MVLGWCSFIYQKKPFTTKVLLITSRFFSHTLKVWETTVAKVLQQQSWNESFPLPPVLSLPRVSPLISRSRCWTSWHGWCQRGHNTHSDFGFGEGYNNNNVKSFSPLLSTRMEVFINASVEGTGVCMCVSKKKRLDYRISQNFGVYACRYIAIDIFAEDNVVTSSSENSNLTICHFRNIKT